MILLRSTVLLSLLFVPALLLAQDETEFSGEVSTEIGYFQAGSSAFQSCQYSRLIVRAKEEMAEGVSLVLQGEVGQQTSSMPLASSWPMGPSSNVINLQADNLSTSNGTVFSLARMDRAYLQWASGPFEVTGGLWKPRDGSAFFFRSTDHFAPVSPLAWDPDPALGSEGGEVRSFLFDDLSADVTARWLSDGRMEWTARLIDKNIAYRIVPSFAHMTGRDGVGLEVSGTFPDLQIRLEGVEWFYSGGPASLEGALGFSGVFRGTAWTLECLRDGTGEALGPLSNSSASGTYLFASVQRSFTAEWQAQAALVKAIEGGPFLFWPKVSWEFESRWKLLFQAQLALGSDPGPLALNPGRAGISMDYSF